MHAGDWRAGVVVLRRHSTVAGRGWKHGGVNVMDSGQS
jgi:hypothetical protein